VGNCACLPERDLRERYKTIHFSCIPEIIHKPSWYEREDQFMDDMYGFAESCVRHYFVEEFYARLLRAGARLDPPYWTGPAGASAVWAVGVWRDSCCDVPR
jgi:hypothetical protein